MWAIKTVNLVKKFKDLAAVNGVNLEIEERECFGLLGPNGAGKTSLIRMITAVSPTTSGEVLVLGQDLKTHDRQVKAILGVVPQHDNLDPELSVMQNLLTFSRYYDIPKKEARQRCVEVLSLFELANKQKSRIRELSGGMKRRLLTARALINQPEILILDEPTVGLDPQSRHLVWNKLRELKAQGVTQLLCTQNMEEAAELCDRVAIMYQGNIVSLDSPQKLVENIAGSEIWEIEIRPEEKNRLMAELSARRYNFDADEQKIQVFNMDSDQFIHELGLSPYQVKHRPATLEDVFFKITGRSLKE
jgi:lipooligosaccharide transport system ATP-binding protein